MIPYNLSTEEVRLIENRRALSALEQKVLDGTACTMATLARKRATKAGINFIPTSPHVIPIRRVAG